MYGPVKEALNLLNAKKQGKYAALVFGDIWPLPQKKLVELADQAAEIINVEQNATGQLAAVIREVTGISCTSSILRYDGRPMSAGDIAEKLEGQV
jgi:2-oxoglutarate ferredoxin oxidoreductase subunit alpha